MSRKYFKNLLAIIMLNVILITLSHQILIAQSAWPWKISEKSEDIVLLLIMGDTNIQNRQNQHLL